MSAGIKADASGTFGTLQVGGVDVVTFDSTGITAGVATTYLKPLTSGTAVATTSGTAHDFTGIPSWVKRITIMFNSVSLSGTAQIRVQIGDSGGVSATGYTGLSANILAATANAATLSAGIDFGVASSATSINGSLVITKLDTLIWTFQGIASSPTGTILSTQVSGSKSLSGALDRVRITSSNGTDTFDLGSINILYE
jgi:hypothetical protein